MTPPYYLSAVFAILLVSNPKYGGKCFVVASIGIDGGNNEGISGSSDSAFDLSLIRDGEETTSTFALNLRDTTAIDDRRISQEDIKYDSLENLEDWPWSRPTPKSGTSQPTYHGHQSSAPSKTPIHTSCYARTSCEECSSVKCHWCSFDEKCHIRGSPYGCALGASCESKNHTKPPDPVDKSCGAHKTCTECALSSNFCHWCAFDEHCHAVGSWYGCAHGTNCYSNKRCRRLTPELIPTTIFSGIGFMPIFLIASIGICAFSCSSVIYGGVKTLQRAYDDLAEARAPALEAHQIPGAIAEGDCDDGIEDPLLDEDDNEERLASPCDHDTDDSMGISNGMETSETDTENLPHNNHATGSLLQDENREQTDTESLLQDNHASVTEHTEQINAENLLTSPVTAHPDPSRIPRPPVDSRNINCLVHVCRAWYICTSVGVLVFLILSFCFFPRIPEYSFCSDEFAWKSIINSITSLKVAASFELLLSLENKNYLNIDLEGFAGIFKYKNETVGKFNLRDTRIAATSITDVLISCTVAPSKWEVLGLIEQYEEGNLVLAVDVNGAVRLTGIAYSFAIKETDILVPVNEPADRHLCVCPEWEDTSSPTPAVIPQFVIDHNMESAVSLH